MGLTMTGASDRLGLPRSRSFRRGRPLRLWWLALVIALVANLVVVLGLSQISQLHHPGLTPPLITHALHQVPPDEAPPPPEQPPEAGESQPEEAVAIALPSLDLPSTAPIGALALPALGSLDADLTLPLSIPAFTANTASDSPVLVAAPPGPAAFDTAAERESAFDLDRHYPRAARLRGVEGTTRVRITIEATGRVGAVQVLDSTPPGVFDEAAQRVIRSIRYRPAQAAGQPVASVQDTTIAWTIRR